MLGRAGKADARILPARIRHPVPTQRPGASPELGPRVADLKVAGLTPGLVPMAARARKGRHAKMAAHARMELRVTVESAASVAAEVAVDAAAAAVATLAKVRRTEPIQRGTPAHRRQMARPT